jgi:hypothetical protein
MTGVLCPAHWPEHSGPANRTIRADVTFPRVVLVSLVALA